MLLIRFFEGHPQQTLSSIEDSYLRGFCKNVLRKYVNGTNWRRNRVGWLAKETKDEEVELVLMMFWVAIGALFTPPKVVQGRIVSSAAYFEVVQSLSDDELLWS